MYGEGRVGSGAGTAWKSPHSSSWRVGWLDDCTAGYPTFNHILYIRYITVLRAKGVS